MFNRIFKCLNLIILFLNTLPPLLSAKKWIKIITVLQNRKTKDSLYLSKWNKTIKKSRILLTISISMKIRIFKKPGLLTRITSMKKENQIFRILDLLKMPKLIEDIPSLQCILKNCIQLGLQLVEIFQINNSMLKGKWRISSLLLIMRSVLKIEATKERTYLNCTAIIKIRYNKINWLVQIAIH